MAQCQICGRTGWFKNDVCVTCIPEVEERSVKHLKKLENTIKLGKITKDLKKRLFYYRDIINQSKRLFLIYEICMPIEAKKIKKIIIEYNDSKFNIEWEITKQSVDKLMARAKGAVTQEGRVNFTKKALLELRRLKKNQPEHRKNKKLLEYIDSCEEFVKNELQKKEG